MSTSDAKPSKDEDEPERSLIDINSVRRYKDQMLIISTCVESLNKIVSRRLGPEGTDIENSVNILICLEMMRALVGTVVSFSKSYAEADGDKFLEPGIDPDISSMAREIMNKTQMSIDEFDRNFDSLMHQFQRYLMHLTHLHGPPGM